MAVPVALSIMLAITAVAWGAAPGEPTADGKVFYEYPDDARKPTVILSLSPVEGAEQYRVLCRQEDENRDKDWYAAAPDPELRLTGLEYGKLLECYFGAANAEGLTVSPGGPWLIPVLVRLPRATKITLSTSLRPGQSYRVAWTERQRIPRWVPRTAYVTMTRTLRGQPVARTVVRKRLARNARLRIPSSVTSGTYFICVTIENDSQGNTAIPRSACTKRVVSSGYSDGGSSGGGSSAGGAVYGGSTGAKGQTGGIGPVVV